MSSAFAELTPEVQTQRLLELLEKAEQSRGARRPVLSVGRDGVTLREYRYRFFEHATVATVTVYDRAGHRLGTVYLAFAPQPGQQEMTHRLTALLEEVLRRWQGPLPRLTYVTDAGENETQYYRRVLAKMVHPHGGEVTLDSHCRLLPCRPADMDDGRLPSANALPRRRHAALRIDGDTAGSVG